MFPQFHQEGFPPFIRFLLGLVGCYVGYILGRRYFLLAHHRVRFSAVNNCQPVPRYPHKDPIFGLDLFFENIRLIKHGGILEGFRARYKKVRPQSAGPVYTFSQLALGRMIINTCEPVNVQTILAKNFNDYELSPLRKKAMEPIFGHGIFSTDGEEWESSRKLLKPCFEKKSIGDLIVHELHVRKLIDRIPKDGVTVDLQELFFELTMDSATEFLFGESTNTLGSGNAAGKEFNDAFTYCLWKTGIQARVGKLGNILPDPKFTRDKAFIHEYISAYVKKAVSLAASSTAKPNPHHYIFLEHLAQAGHGEKKIQDELMNILLAGRDTTATLLSHMWYVLARRPDVFNKLRAEVRKYRNQVLTPELINEMKYLRWCLNETLRLWPVVPVNTRGAVIDTTLPLGGGEDGKSPVFVPKGTLVVYPVYVMHRRKDIFGEDADEFKPERWKTLRPGWAYLPFNGGPRICIGQQFALIEASYTTIKLLQEFKAIEARDDTKYCEGFTVTLSVKGGTLVSLTPA
ncbi:cytochrome P450 [Calycina marina]|uniref:Cytochrome P450 n=1 Tax=Calycina marina TaxID=1763456 RepID=A0A9P8CFZ8_9HELO|nr:cytochrome P450 [Calycina marina]